MLSRTLSRGSLVSAALPASSRRPLDAILSNGALLVGGVLLIALCAHLRLVLPFSPVPITGQTFAVLLLAAAYGWRRGTTTVLLYIAAGVANLPVFAAASGPFTYGYLAGFVLAALVVGWLAERGWDRSFLTAVVAMLAGEVAIYAGGLVWLARYVGWNKVIALGLTPFLIGDALKLLAAATILPALWLFVRAARKR